MKQKIIRVVIARHEGQCKAERKLSDAGAYDAVRCTHSEIVASELA